MGGPFIPDPSRPHLRYPWDFAREAKMQILKPWSMSMVDTCGPPPRPPRRNAVRREDIETAHQHLIAQVRLHKADVIGRLESGSRDWNGLRKALTSYIEFQTGADVISGQTPLDGMSHRN